MQSWILKHRRRFPAAVLGAMVAGLCLSVASLNPAFAADSAKTGSTLPEGLRPALYRALVTGAETRAPVAQNGCSSLSQSALKACFGRHGARFTGPDAQPLTLRLAAFGRGAELAPIGAPEREIAHGRVNYRYGALTEWWRAVPSGYEQGFTVPRRPAGTGRLALVLAVNHSPRQYEQGLGWGRLRYGGLAVTDARGHRLPSSLGADGTRISITIDDRGAQYPLTVDPVVWIQQQVKAPAATTTSEAQAAPAAATVTTAASAFGASVVLAGETAFIGAPFTSVLGTVQQGAVYVFAEASDRSWAESAMLTASDGAAFDQFGSRLAVSGANLLVGAPGADVGGNAGQGAAYVFALDGDGVWGETQKLTASDGAAGDEFGGALAVSGSEALIGARYAMIASNAGQGAVYVFSAPDGTWSETQKLTAGDGAAGDLFGSTLALDGTTALVGAPAASIDGNSLSGAAYAFANAGGTWSEVQKLTADDGAAGNLFGSAIALDGATALIGAPDASASGNLNRGKVYVFTNAVGAWTQTVEFIAEDGTEGDQFGAAIALADGHAVVGGEGESGRAYYFDGTGDSWVQSVEFFGAGAGYGRAVAIGDITVLIGTPNVAAGTSGGAVYFIGRTDLSLAYDAPDEAKPNSEYRGNITLTNSAATASPSLTLLALAPAGATMGSVTTTQGDCTSEESGVSCDLGQVAGNGGRADVAVNFTVTAQPATTIYNLALVANATPSLTAGAAVRVPGQPSSGGGGGALGLLGLLALCGLVAGAAIYRRRTARVKT